MRFLLPIVLLILGVVLVMPLIRTAAAVASAGAPDATAMSFGIGALIQQGIGLILLIAGLLMILVRLFRRNTSGSS